VPHARQNTESGGLRSPQTGQISTAEV
jgi:hypothetical protein